MDAPKTEKKKVVFPNANPGTPVKEGKNWVTGLTHQQRQQVLLNHENKWKNKYNATRGTHLASQTISRG